MISRRLVRIKVMQFVYSCNITNTDANQVTVSQLTKSLYNVEQAMFHILLLMLKVRALGDQDTIRRKNKNLKLEEDFKFINRLNSNPFLIAIADHYDFHNYIQLRKNVLPIDEYVVKNILDLEWDELKYDCPDTDVDVLHSIYKMLLGKDIFKKYSSSDFPINWEQHHKFSVFLFKKVLLKNEMVSDYLEQEYLGWPDSNTVVISIILSMIKDFYENKKLTMPDMKTKESVKFGTNLFLKTMEHQESYKMFLNPVLKNWDVSRMNPVDLHLIDLALTEMIYFPDIPIKVTMNEYIEISKEYSTPKSKEFVNGILDTIMKQLVNDKIINKSGRGLFE